MGDIGLNNMGAMAAALPVDLFEFYIQIPRNFPRGNVDDLLLDE